MDPSETTSPGAQAPQLAALRDRHRDFYTAFVDDVRAAAEAADPSERTDWADLVEAELSNLRKAYEWALAAGHPAALALPAGLAWFWVDRRRMGEGAAWLGRALATAEHDDPRRDDALDAVAFIALHAGDHTAAAEAARERVELVRQRGVDGELRGALLRLGNAEHMARRLHEAAGALEEARGLRLDVQSSIDVIVRARATRGLGVVSFELGDAQRAVALHEEALRLLREAADDAALAEHLGAHAFFLTRVGRPAEADELLAEAADLHRRLGRDDLLAQVVYLRAHAAANADRSDDAARLATEAADLSREARDVGALAAALEVGARVALATGDRDRSAVLIAEGIDALRTEPELTAIDRNHLASLLRMKAAAAEDAGDVEGALEAYGEAVEVSADGVGWAWRAPSVLALARCRADHGDAAGARRELEREQALWSAQSGTTDPMALWMETERAILLDELDAAASSARAWVDVVRADPAPPQLSRALWTCARVHVLAGDLLEATAAVDEAIAVAGRDADRLLAHLLRAEVRVLRGDAAAAAADLREVAHRRELLVWTKDHVRVAEVLAAVTAEAGRPADAARLVAVAEACRNVLRLPRKAEAIAIVSRSAITAPDTATVDLDEARALIREELRRLEIHGPPPQ